ncbi:2311_t:CDS:1, partial [Ambispora leptoticha]
MTRNENSHLPNMGDNDSYMVDTNSDNFQNMIDLELREQGSELRNLRERVQQA